MSRNLPRFFGWIRAHKFLWLTTTSISIRVGVHPLTPQLPEFTSYHIHAVPRRGIRATLCSRAANAIASLRFFLCSAKTWVKDIFIAMDAAEEIKRLRAALKSSEETQAELDKTVFSLQTLHDISADLYGSIEKESIMHNFLLMCMGNFGSKRGFLMLMNLLDRKINHDTALGYAGDDLGPLRGMGKMIAEHKGRKTCILPAKGLDLMGPMSL